jgi:hypothetical protein
MTDETETYGIVPHFFYRKTDPETRRIIGLRPTQIDEAVRNGDLPPPASVTSIGRAVGWQGATLIEIIRARQQRAAEEHARKTAAAAEPASSKKKRGKPLQPNAINARSD